MSEMPVKRERIPLLDALRGLSILLMIAYHAGYDLVMAGYLPLTALYNPLLNVLTPLFAGVFILLAGISSRFSRNNLRRGLLTLGCAVLVSAVSLVTLPAPWLSLRAALGFPTENADIGRLVLSGQLSLHEDVWTAVAQLGANPEPALVGGAVMRFYDHPSHVLGAPILIGILHLMAACMLLYWLLEKISRRAGLSAQDLSIVLGVPLIAAFITVYLNLGAWPDIPSADYFPIIPWGFIFFFGVYLGGPIQGRLWPDWFYRFDMPLLPAVGRRTLIIYLAHQPVLYAVLFLMDTLGG